MAVFAQYRDIVVRLAAHFSKDVVSNLSGSIYSLLISQINRFEHMANFVFMTRKYPKIPCQDVGFYIIISIIPFSTLKKE